MSKENTNVQTCVCEVVGAERLRREFEHLRADWWWLLLYGVLLTVCGAVAIVFPALTSVAAMVVLGVVLMIAGIVTIVTAFWAGKWSGALLQMFVGVLYLVVGLLIRELPVASAITMTMFVAAFFIVAGGSRAGGVGCPLPILGLGAAERRRHVPPWRDYLQALSEREPLGSWTADRHRDAVQRLDLDHVVVGDSQDSNGDRGLILWLQEATSDAGCREPPAKNPHWEPPLSKRRFPMLFLAAEAKETRFPINSFIASQVANIVRWTSVRLIRQPKVHL